MFKYIIVKFNSNSVIVLFSKRESHKVGRCGVYFITVKAANISIY